MIQLIYYSVASSSVSKTDIHNILETSRKNNSKNDITGCLLYYNDAFLQILEGAQNVVEPLYYRIEQDQRHHSVRKVHDDYELQKRLFKNWSMGFYDLDNSDMGKAGFRKSFIAIAEHTVQPTVAGQLFWDIADQLLDQ